MDQKSDDILIYAQEIFISSFRLKMITPELKIHYYYFIITIFITYGIHYY